VTRHLDFELKQTDWDVMILHYLGLDHVGHIEGPFAPVNIRRKLHEMDEVIRLIYSSLNENDLMMVLSDHGMANEGGHGGSSQMEITTPVLFLTKPAVFSHDSKQSETKEEMKSFQQVDLLSTLSCLFNLRVPNENQGVMFINDLFASIEQSYSINNKRKMQIQTQIFKCLIDNANQLSQMSHSNETSAYQHKINSFKTEFFRIFNNHSIEIQDKLDRFTELNRKAENLIRKEHSSSNQSHSANMEQIFFMIFSIMLMINVSS